MYVCMCVCTYVKVKSLSQVQLFATPWTVAYQASQSMEFPRQEYWSGLPFPSAGDLPDPEIEPRSPTLQADALPSEPPGKPVYVCGMYVCIFTLEPGIEPSSPMSPALADEFFTTNTTWEANTYISHKIYHLNHLKLCASVALSPFTLLCHHHH